MTFPNTQTSTADSSESAGGAALSSEPVVQAPASAPAEGGQPDPAAASGIPAETPAFQPNFKYKVDRAEKEIPEMYRALIKDADTEKQVRELFEKTDGFEAIKPRHQQLREKFEEVNQQHTHLTESLDDLRADYQRGDFDSFFAKLEIPQEKIVDWLVSKVEYEKLPVDQRRILDRNRDADRRAYETERQASQREEMYMGELTRARAYALDVALDRGPAQTAAQAYDARNGEGSFRNLVIERGEMAWYRSKGQTDLSPEQAIQEALKVIGHDESAAPGQGAAQSTGNQPAARAATIPNLGGKSSSPVKPKVQTLDDLKKLAASF